MRILLWLIVLFAIAVGLSVLTNYYEAEFIIKISSTIYTMSFNAVILGIILLFLVIRILGGFLFYLLSIPSFVKRVKYDRDISKVDANLNDAVLAYFEGRYQRAQQLIEGILSNKRLGARKLLALIVGAQSADAASEYAIRDQYLSELEKMPKKNQIPRYLLLAQSALDMKKYDEALDYIQQVRSMNSKLTQLAQLEYRYGVETQNNSFIFSSLNVLEKNKAVSEDKADEYRIEAYRTSLDSVNKEGLVPLVKKIPDLYKKNELLVAIARKFQTFELYDKSADWVLKYYPFTREDQLLLVLADVYPYLSGRRQKKIFKILEKWLKNEQGNAFLLLTLGQFSYHKELWGKAQSYLEASISIETSQVAYITLSKVFRKIGRMEEAEEIDRLLFSFLNKDGNTGV